jgi:hypothetical protein
MNTDRLLPMGNDSSRGVLSTMVDKLIDAAAQAGFRLVRACDLSQNEQPQAANLGRSDSSTASTDTHNSNVYNHEGKR